MGKGILQQWAERVFRGWKTGREYYKHAKETLLPLNDFSETRWLRVP